MNEQKAKPGRVKQITALSNPVIKSIKSLNLKKNRDTEGVFVAEGLKLITDALHGGWTIRTLIYANSAQMSEHLPNVAAKARSRGADILEVSEKVLTSITRKDNPQMVIGVIEQKWVKPETIKPDNGDVWIALDRIRDPGNLGTIIRTADAVGAKGVILVGETTDPYSFEAVRATMGSIFNIEVSRLGMDEFSGFRKNWNGSVIGTHLEGAVDYRDIDYTNGPILLLMGNEQQGLPPLLAAQCDKLAFIPMDGKADSLNLAISTGVMLYEIRRHALQMKAR